MIWPRLTSITRDAIPAALAYPPWLGPAPVEFMHQHYAEWNARTSQLGSAHARRLQLVDGFARIVSGGHQYEAMRHGLVSYPYADKAVIEFLISAPASQLLRPNDWRSLQRRTFGARLPLKVSTRTGKRGPGEAIVRGVTRQWELIAQWFTDSHCARLKLIDRDKFRDYLHTVKHGNQRWTGLLPWLISLEAWFRAREAVASPEVSRGASWGGSNA